MQEITILVNGVYGTAMEDQLQKSELVLENDNERATVIEYCFKDCPAPVHQDNAERIVEMSEGKASCLCPAHVHRSVHVHLKKSPLSIEMHQAMFGSR